MALLVCSACSDSPVAQQEEIPAIFQLPELKTITDKIQKNPDKASLYFERGVKLARLHQDTLALQDLKKAVSLDSTRAEYYSAIGDLLFETKNITESVQWLEKAIRLNPSDPTAHLKIAKMFLYLQDHNRAFAEINTVLKENAMIPEAYFLKGMVYKDRNDTIRALSSFMTAVQVDPQYTDALMQLGLLYSQQKNPVAIKYFKNAFETDTTDVYPIYAQGMFYQEEKKYEEAKQAYVDCIMRDISFADAYFSLGWILMQQDSLEKAWRQFDLATKQDPLYVEAYYNRGLCSELMGKKTDAIADYEQVLSFDPEFAAAKEAMQRLRKK